MENGLPEAWGWILLALAPASFLLAIVVLWGSELPASLRDLARTRAGRVVVVVLAAVVVVEGVWVARKVQAARTVTAFAGNARDDGVLAADYPRQTVPAPDFTLVDQHGARVSPDRFRGRPVIVTFVFGHCQTMCPLVVETLKHVPPSEAPAAVLLVTLDPWRDTPGSLAGIAGRWALPPNFHVLSSRPASDVLAVAAAYGVPAERDEKTGDITHPGLVFVIDADGRLAYTFNNPSTTWIRAALVRAGRAHARRG